MDLPGFGWSEMPERDISIDYYGEWTVRLLDALEIDSAAVVGNSMGGFVGAELAIRAPERVQRLVVIDAVPLLAGFSWRGPARMVRAPLIGPIAVGSATKTVLRLLSRRASAGRGPMPEPFVANVAAGFDLGTERAVLRLLRSASPELLAEAGADLGAIDAPALVLWGADDPYIPVRFGAGYAATLGDATLEVVEDAGHWPWIDRPEVSVRIVEHLQG
jgi:pimeloyl-ACP methyl ester carboxylesterase